MQATESISERIGRYARDLGAVEPWSDYEFALVDGRQCVYEWERINGEDQMRIKLLGRRDGTVEELMARGMEVRYPLRIRRTRVVERLVDKDGCNILRRVE